MKKYLIFIEKSGQINKRFELGDREIKLLDLVGKSHYTDVPVFVFDLISRREIGSQATLHATLKKLINKKLFCFKPYEADGRRKIITLTSRALERYKQLDIALMNKRL